MQIKQISTDAFLITFDSIISKEILKKVQIVNSILHEIETITFHEIVPSYSSILVRFDVLEYDFNAINKYLKSAINFEENIEFDNEIINIDVYYSQEVGYDLDSISHNKQLTIDEIIQIHSDTIYDIYAIGFLPGFGFLGNVDDKIASPRLKNPRKKIPAGSVGIADKQTAVYPSDSAGGWNIIGRTTQKLFFKNNPINSISPLKVGKRVKFNPITKKEYLNQGGGL